MASNERQRLLNEIEYLKSLVDRHDAAGAALKASPTLVRKVPKGPSRSWRNPALLVQPHPPPSEHPASYPVAAAPSKILVNPNFKGSKILVNPNFELPKKILVNPAFRPKSIHVNPEVLPKPPTPKAAQAPKSPRVLFKSKNKLILKKQTPPTADKTKPKISPLIFKSKNKWVRRASSTVTIKNPPAKPTSQDKRKRGSMTLIAGEQFVKYGATRLTRLQSIKKQVMQRSLSVLAKRKRRSLVPCIIFRKFGRCPRGENCGYQHVVPQTLFNCIAPPSSSTNKVLKNTPKKKDSRYYLNEEQVESEAMRPQRNKTVGELPSFIPL